MTKRALANFTLTFCLFTSFLCFGEAANNTVAEEEALLVSEVATEWPWPWRPEIHKYHKFFNLSQFPPEVWDAIRLGQRVESKRNNFSSVALGWMSTMEINRTLAESIYIK